jgi:hypothetical protein
MQVMNPGQTRRFLEHTLLTRYGTLFTLAVRIGRASRSDVDWGKEAVTVA